MTNETPQVLPPATECALCLDTLPLPNGIATTYQCGVCELDLCRKCVEILPADAFSYFSKIPKILKHAHYCLRCYDQHVAPEKARYDELMEKAKEVYFLTKEYRGYIRILKRHTKRVQVAECPDRRETIVRLAFYAAELGLNAVVESEVDAFKTRDPHGYQSALWKGSALPCTIDGAQLERSSLRRV